MVLLGRAADAALFGGHVDGVGVGVGVGVGGEAVGRGAVGEWVLVGGGSALAVDVEIEVVGCEVVGGFERDGVVESVLVELPLHSYTLNFIANSIIIRSLKIGSCCGLYK